LSHTIRADTPLSVDLAPLMARHSAEMFALSPPDSVHMLPAAGLAVPAVAFFTLRDGTGRPVAMGAYKRLDARHAELKSMHVLAECRGQGLSRAMLDHLIAMARADGIARLSLETGSQPGFAPARALYRRAGFKDCEPFGDYRPDPHSVFMTRTI
jgi:putative acetyltransferase